MQVNSINGQQNTQQVQQKKVEKQETEAKLQLQQTNNNQQGGTEVQTLKTLLAKLDQEVAEAETSGAKEGKGKGKGKPPGPPPEILAELNKYGLSPTGSKEGDEAAIAQAKAQLAQQKTAKA